MRSASALRCASGARPAGDASRHDPFEATESLGDVMVVVSEQGLGVNVVVDLHRAGGPAQGVRDPGHPAGPAVAMGVGDVDEDRRCDAHQQGEREEEGGETHGRIMREDGENRQTPRGIGLGCGQIVIASRRRWLITVETPSARIDTPYRASAISMVRFWCVTTRTWLVSRNSS